MPWTLGTINNVKSCQKLSEQCQRTKVNSFLYNNKAGTINYIAFYSKTDRIENLAKNEIKLIYPKFKFLDFSNSYLSHVFYFKLSH